MDREKGLLIVCTGDGKGKTTAALGLALRAWGQGMKVLMLQFIKSDRPSGESKAAVKLGHNFEVRPLGEGFVYNWESDAGGASDSASVTISAGPPEDRHIQAGRQALRTAAEEMQTGKYDLIILDEILYALHYRLIALEDVLALLDGRPERLHLVLTGRYATSEIISKADLVTEMKEIKHPFHKGVCAQAGIEF